MVDCRKCGGNFRIRTPTADGVYDCPSCRTCANEQCGEWVFRPGSLCATCEEDRKQQVAGLSQARPKRGKRRCTRCNTNVLSAYNRGKYCHACWEAMSPLQRRKSGERFVE